MHTAVQWCHPLAYQHVQLICTCPRAPIGSVLPSGTVAQSSGRDLLVIMLHLLSNPSCQREVGDSWTDVAVNLFAGIGGATAEVAEWVARP